MYRQEQTAENTVFAGIAAKGGLIVKFTIFLLCLFSAMKAFSQQPNKIQQAVNAIKAANYCEDEDYHTDGQRTVWVKSYKKWIPDDLVVMKKEAPDVLKFLGQAIQHDRFDVLEQLLPEYYRVHGGAKAFANDILNATRGMEGK